MAPAWLSQLQKGLQPEPTFATRWRAFLTAPAAKGEPTIRPAKVPQVKPLKGQTVDIFAKFRRRG